MGMRKRLAWAVTATTMALCIDAAAQESPTMDLAELDERALEPHIVSQVADGPPGWSVEITAGLGDDGHHLYRDFVSPSVAMGWVLVDADLSVELGTEVTSDGTTLPLALGYRVGPWSLGTELGYTAARLDDDEWALDGELSLALLDGWSMFAMARASAPVDLDEVGVLFHGGARWHGDGVSLLASFGQGIRDTPFDADERLGMLAVRLLL